MRKSTTLLYLLVTFVAGKAQVSTDSLNGELRKIAKPESTSTFIKFKEDATVNPVTIFNELKQAFNLGNDDQMRIFKTEDDELGFTHRRYQQYYKNVKVEDAIFIVHTNKDGFTYAANGKLMPGLDVNITPNITADQAIESALKHVNAKEYKWQSNFWQNELKKHTRNSDTSYYPVPQLVIKEISHVSKGSNTLTNTRHLAYRMDIYTSSPDYSQRIFMDAHTGKVLQVYPLESN
jgi:bacillolysin